MRAYFSPFKSRFRIPHLAGVGIALAVGILFSLGFLAALELSLRLGYRPNIKLSWLQELEENKWELSPVPEVVFPSYVRDTFEELRQKAQKSGSLGPIQRKQHNLGPELYRVEARTAQNDLLYDVTYRYQEGRRITPGQPAKSPLSILMMGCSFTLGEGLEEDQTLPAFLQRLTKNASVHNASWHGWGPGDLLLSIRQADPEQWPSPLKNLPEAPQTIGIFVLGDNHFNRIECGIDCHGTSALWLRARPDFQLDENGQLVYRGRMRETRWFPRWLELLADSAIVKQFNLQVIGKFSQKRQEKMAKILLSLRDELAAKTNLRDFYVMHHAQRDLHDVSPLNNLLRAGGIKVLDPKLKFVELTNGRFSIPEDGHPSPQMNYLLATYLASKIKLDEGISSLR